METFLGSYGNVRPVRHLRHHVTGDSRGNQVAHRGKETPAMVASMAAAGAALERGDAVAAIEYARRVRAIGDAASERAGKLLQDWCA